MKRFKDMPPWVIGGLTGLGINILSVVVVIIVTALGDSGYLNNAQPRVGGLLIPFYLVSLFPAALIPGAYESTSIVLPANFVIYFTIGAAVGVVINQFKRSR